jgi:UDPglucose 6-dehydrogenase
MWARDIEDLRPGRKPTWSIASIGRNENIRGSMKIAIFGLGKLGSVLAALHSNSGNTVVGVDISEPLVKSINSGSAPFMEPGLNELMKMGGSNLSATTVPEEACKEADASIVIVPTPSGPDGRFINEYVIKAVETIGQSIKSLPKRHTIIIASTVMPGSCASEITNALESSSGKKVGKEVGLVYNPQFIALGSIVSNMRKPDLILIGESDLEAGQVALDLAQAIAENQPAVSRIGLASAELAKLAINTFVTTKISFANMLGEFCDHLDGANIDDVTSAVGSDSRIGKKYLQGALGYGGPCFPRDNIALAASADTFGIDASIAVATDSINNRQVRRVLNLVSSLASSGSSVTVFGLAYKPDTPVCDESQSIEIANALFEAGYKVLSYDELVSPEDSPRLNTKVESHRTPSEAIYSSDVAVFTHPVGSFKELDLSRLSSGQVIDIWGSIDKSSLPVSAELIRPGRITHEGLVRKN